MKLGELGFSVATFLMVGAATAGIAGGEGIGYQPTGYTEVCSSTRMPIVTSAEGLTQVGNQGIYKTAENKLVYYAGQAAGGIKSAISISIKTASLVFGACMAFDALAFEARAEEFYPPVDSYCQADANFFKGMIRKYRMYNIPDPLKPTMFNAMWANNGESVAMALLICQEKFGGAYDPMKLLDEAIAEADAITKAVNGG